MYQEDAGFRNSNYRIALFQTELYKNLLRKKASDRRVSVGIIFMPGLFSGSLSDINISARNTTCEYR